MAIKLPEAQGEIVLGEQPRRIVSLVPSVTEALFVYGLGHRVVGITEWCVHPAAAVAPLPKVGGTKNPSIKAILELEPDLVIANHEENRRIDVERLRAADVTVWVTFPQTVAAGVALLGELTKLGQFSAGDLAEIEDLAQVVVKLTERSYDKRARVFCPIWRDPWMSIGASTYINNLIFICGGSNIFASHADRRYPKVTLEQVELAQPEVILLPSEPYQFSASDAEELAQLAIPAAKMGRIHLIDGTYVSWYGPRIRPALSLLYSLLK